MQQRGGSGAKEKGVGEPLLDPVDGPAYTRLQAAPQAGGVRSGGHAWLKETDPESDTKESLLGDVEMARVAHVGPQKDDRMTPSALAQIFFEPGEKPVLDAGAIFQCKTIELERSRVHKPTQLSWLFADYLPAFRLDDPVEELPGRHVLFTNQRIIIVDSSYLSVKAEEVESPHLSVCKMFFCNCGLPKGAIFGVLIGLVVGFLLAIGFDNKLSNKTLVGGMLALCAVAGAFIGARYGKKLGPLKTEEHIKLQIDSLLSDDLRKVKYAAAVKGHEGSASANIGWGSVGGLLQKPLPRVSPGGPSASLPFGGGLIELTLEEEVFARTEIDFKYFRSFPLSAIIDARLDFVVGRRTFGRFEKTSRTGFCNELLAFFRCGRTYMKGKHDNTENIRRQVMLRLSDQGTLVLDISEAHSTMSIAKAVAALLPTTNEFQKQETRLRTETREVVKRACAFESRVKQLEYFIKDHLQETSPDAPDVEVGLDAKDSGEAESRRVDGLMARWKMKVKQDRFNNDAFAPRSSKWWRPWTWF